MIISSGRTNGISTEPALGTIRISLTSFRMPLIACTLTNSTLGSNCVDSTDQAIVYYLDAAVDLFKGIPTYNWLAAAGITPSRTATYSRNQIVRALKARYGFTVGLDCQSNTLKEVYYYHHVRLCRFSYPNLVVRHRLIKIPSPQLKGSIHDGQYLRVDAITPGDCPSDGIKYPLKRRGSSGMEH
jgi:ribonuclease T2